MDAIYAILIGIAWFVCGPIVYLDFKCSILETYRNDHSCWKQKHRLIALAFACGGPFAMVPPMLRVVGWLSGDWLNRTARW